MKFKEQLATVVRRGTTARLMKKSRSSHDYAGQIDERRVIADGIEVFFVADQVAVVGVEVERFA